MDYLSLKIITIFIDFLYLHIMVEQKSKSYAPYIYAIVLTISFTITHKVFLKSGFTLCIITSFFFYVGLWFLIEWLLIQFEHKNKLVQWLMAMLGVCIYLIVYFCLDTYVLHIVTNILGFTFWQLSKRVFVSVVLALIFIESQRWTKEREKAQIENLKLQAENIETKFQLLKEQVNPEFLFHCLNTLQTMVRADDPKTEDYILKLANVYRQILKKHINTISVKEEVELLQSYMFLICYGREEEINFEMNISEASFDRQLPIFALQLLVDKCIKHNEFSANQPLRILFFQKDANSITMTHNYQPKADTTSIDFEKLENRYALEGIENGVEISKGTSIYSITLMLL